MRCFVNQLETAVHSVTSSKLTVERGEQVTIEWPKQVQEFSEKCKLSKASKNINSRGKKLFPLPIHIDSKQKLHNNKNIDAP